MLCAVPALPLTSRSTLIDLPQFSFLHFRSAALTTGFLLGLCSHDSTFGEKLTLSLFDSLAPFQRILRELFRRAMDRVFSMKTGRSLLRPFSCFRAPRPRPRLLFDEEVTDVFLTKWNLLGPPLGLGSLELSWLGLPRLVTSRSSEGLLFSGRFCTSANRGSLVLRSELCTFKRSSWGEVVRILGT